MWAMLEEFIGIGWSAGGLQGEMEGLR